MTSYDKDGTAGVVVTSKVSQVGAIPDGIQWFAPGFGIVKTADYNRGGKEVGSTVLTAFKQ